jgi:hypothetical protein
MDESMDYRQIGVRRRKAILKPIKWTSIVPPENLQF